MDFNNTTPGIGPEWASESLRFGPNRSMFLKLLAAANPLEVSAAHDKELHRDMLDFAMDPPPSGAWPKAIVTTWTR